MFGHGSFRLLMIALSFLGLPSGAVADLDGKLLEFVLAAHQASREAIRTLHARVAFQGTLNGKATPDQECHGEFWLDSERIRGRYAEAGLENDFDWRGGVRRMVHRKLATSEVSASIAKLPSRHFARCDPMVRGLLFLQEVDTGHHYSLEALLSKAARITGCAKRRAGGAEVIQIEAEFKARGRDREQVWSFVIDVDPAAGFLVRKFARATSDLEGGFEMVNEVVKFKELADGLRFPAEIRGTSGPKGAPNWTSVAVVSDLQVNEPLPSDIFDFRFPRGVWLTDSIRGEAYSVDAAGQQISQSITLDKHPPPPLAEKSGATAATSQEPVQRLSTLLIPAAFVALAFLGTIICLRRRKAE